MKTKVCFQKAAETPNSLGKTSGTYELWFYYLKIFQETENNGKSHPSSSSNWKHLFSVYKELKQDLLFLDRHFAALVL